MTRRLAVIGAAGALGYSVVTEALARGLEVVAVMRRPRPGLLPAGAQLVAGDAGDAAGLARAIGATDALCYCVNVPLPEWPTRLLALCGSAIAAANRLGARFVFPANVWVYGPRAPGVLLDEQQPLTPSSRKGQLRAQQEALVRAQATRWAMVRLPEFYGPNVANRLVGAPFRAALAGQPLTWMGGRLDVDVEYVYMPDGAHAMIDVATAGDTDGQVFHLPGAAVTTPRRFLTAIATSAGVEPRVRAFPGWLLRLGALVHPMAREFADILHLWTDPVLLDGARYRARFGTLPATPYEQGIERTLAWFRAHPDATNAN